MTEDDPTRRDVLAASALGCALLTGCGENPSAMEDGGGEGTQLPVDLTPAEFSGNARLEAEGSPLDDADTYAVESSDDSLRYASPDGIPPDARYLTFDLVAWGTTLPTFQLELHEADTGMTFTLNFGALNGCGVRVRLPLEATNQVRWRYPREGGWLKPVLGGDRVRLSRVDAIELSIVRKDDGPVYWDQTPIRLTGAEPPTLTSPLLPDGPLLDEFGQSTLHEWGAMTRSEEELTGRIREQFENASAAEWPSSFSRWGGWSARRFESTGFFRTHHDGERWWLVDPDGHPFWSAGINQVRPKIETGYENIENAFEWLPDDGALYDVVDGEPVVDFLEANLRRAFGADSWRERWTDITVAELLDTGFNTVGNWSEWHRVDDATLPYVRQLERDYSETPLVYRDFPDVYRESFEREAVAIAEQLEETADDPALIGYFLENEPEWSFAEEVPAAGMLYTTETCETRRVLADRLRERYGSDGALADAWGIETSFAEIERGRWTRPLPDAATADLRTFSTRMVERLYGTISDSCRTVDPNHLNLGVRFHDVPPGWVLRGLRSVDVFTLNWYEPAPPTEEVRPILTELEVPVLVGEWHVGALDVGLPASGLTRVGSQDARGAAYRAYLEAAASKPWCVGAHYYALYDQSALGRYDGENYNIGFFDVCNRRYEPLHEGARTSHERIYGVATGERSAYTGSIDYLDPLF